MLSLRSITLLYRPVVPASGELTHLTSPHPTSCGGSKRMSEQKVLTGREGLSKIGELIQDVRICMMVTVASDGSMDARPMATQKTAFDGTGWFLTRHESGKVAEMERDSHVTLVYSDPNNANYVTAKGRATIS